jgi:hypothetical protein
MKLACAVGFRFKGLTHRIALTIGLLRPSLASMMQTNT